MSETKNKAEVCFIDTNVWLYAFIESQDKEKTGVAKNTIQNREVIVSTQVISEVCVNLIKKTQFDETNIQNLIESFYGNYRVIEIDKEILLKASELRNSYQFSYWDSTIVACALLGGATILYSEDLDTGVEVEKRLKIVNPFKPVKKSK